MDKQLIEQVSAAAEALRAELTEMSRTIHDNPELGGQEFLAQRLQVDLLRKYGFEVEENYCDFPTAYRAVYKGKKPGPKIAMLAEYDALPKLGHGCGHNLIAMMSVGSGIAMREFADEFGAEIYVYGTPAEETAGTKVEMSKRGVFKDMDVAMMAHPANENSSSINSMAIFCRRFEFFGRAAHAASAPEQGLNALDAMINFFNLINALRQQTKDDARIHGVIQNGGEAPNIIPDYTSALFYIRSSKTAQLEKLMERVEECAKGAALGTGTTVKITPDEVDFKDTCSNMYLNELACRQMELLGVPMRRLGDTPHMGSSDLGDVSYECPSIQLNSWMGPPLRGKNYYGHTVEFEEMACTQTAFDNAMNFIKGFVMTAIELMTDPSHLAAIWEEFARMER
jgi:amidohydrolase